ncbi:MAG: SusC/RagA family TonB-linked outer membrane protein [Bacteroidales bacterium]|nr:SusC/RagA family TonB-linked outer membrane protein [Bacteroidales bacterium]
MKTIRYFIILLLTLLPLHGLGQVFRTVTGTVSDARGETVIGAAVQQKGTGIGVVTDTDGRYVIRLKDATAETELVFTSLGYNQVAVKIGKRSVVDVVLEDSEFAIEEAVIQTGYGVVQKRSDLTGSAFQVEGKALSQLPATRIDNMLEGMVPGMRVETTNSNGRPRVKIRVRGDASLNASSEPLWIVDGVPIYTGSKTGQITGTSYDVSPMSMINPDDIESITVLKDAATTTLYGADGSNGVILVTTKSGSSDKTRINVSVRSGVSRVDRTTLLRVCTTEQWWDLATEAWLNSGRPIEAFPYQDNEHNSYSTTDTDWYDVYYGLGNDRQVNFSASGGSRNMSNYLSISYYGNNSTVKGNEQNRYTIRNKSGYRFSDRLSIDFTVAGGYNVNDVFSLTSSYYKVLPIFSPYDEDGVTPRLYNYYSLSDTEYNPVQRKFVYNYVPERDLSDNRQSTVTGDANSQIQWKPLNGLSLTSTVGVSAISIYEGIYEHSQTLDGIYDTGLNGYSRRSGVFSFTINNINRINFNRTFGRHSVSAMGAIEFTDKKHRYLYATGHGFINDHIKELSYADKSTRDGTSNTTYTRSLSYLGQATYSYDRRYYLSASWRRQGNSSFSTYSRWGSFLSIGASWNVHNEKWFNSDVVKNLKLKASYGNNGNSRLDTSSSYGTYVYSDSSFYGGIMGAHQGTPPNPGLSWERTYIQNYGVSVGLWNRLTIDVEGYSKLTKDLLYSGRVSSVITDGTVTRNVGEIENLGIEVNVEARIIDKNDFEWTMSANGSRNRNIIRKLYKGMHTGFFDYVWMEGASKDAWWLVRWAGVDPNDGSPMWYDYNGNLTYTFSYDNRVLLPQYDKYPSLSGGFQQQFSYKNLSLNLLFAYDIGGWDQYIYRTDGHGIMDFNVLVEELDHWREPGQVATNPRFVYKEENYSSMSSTRDLMSTTNIHFRSAALSYNLPKRLVSNLKMSSATVRFIVDNPYLWSPDQRRDRNCYKNFKYASGMTRTYSAELSVSF